MKMCKTFIKVICFLLIMSITFTQYIYAQTNNNSISIEEKTVDNTINTLLSTYNIPGAVLVIVKDGKTYYEKGYGFANIESKVPVDPDKTMFNIGSVGKLFTSIAVMQLVEKEKLDLNEDVNKYLADFKIKNEYSKPVTLGNLLTHTGGFDSSYIGMNSRKYSSIVPLGEFLKKNMPPLIREPGEIIQYDNYGMALAGYIVEQASNLSFSQYIENYIFQPLDMKNSSCLSTTDNKESIATSYINLNGINQPGIPAYLNIVPAGDIMSTGSDMANFMIANLHKGIFQDKSILKEETIQDMQKLHFANYPDFPGMAYGLAFNEGVLSKGGDTSDNFHTQMSLLPDENMGVFISLNGGSREALNILFNAVISQLSDKIYVQPDYKQSNYPDNIKDFEGLYRHTENYIKKSIAKVQFLSPSQSGDRITSDGKNVLFYRNELFKRINPFIFENSRGDYLAFKKDSSGEIKYMAALYGDRTSVYFEFNSISSYEKVPWHENYIIHTSLLLLFAIVFILTIFRWIFILLYRLIKKTHNKKGIVYLFGELLSVTISVLNIFSIISSIAFIPQSVLGNDASFGIPVGINLLLVLPVITTLLTALMGVFLIISQKDKQLLLSQKVHYVFLVFSSAAFILLLNYWCLVGFNF